ALAAFPAYSSFYFSEVWICNSDGMGSVATGRRSPLLPQTKLVVRKATSFTLKLYGMCTSNEFMEIRLEKRRLSGHVSNADSKRSVGNIRTQFLPSASIAQSVVSPESGS